MMILALPFIMSILTFINSSATSKQIGNTAVFLLEWGNFNNDNGKNYYPHAVAVGLNGEHIFVTDPANSRVLKYETSTGRYLLSWRWGNLLDENGGLRMPKGAAVDPVTGDIYIADTENHRIIKYDSNGNYILEWGDYGQGDGQFFSPYGIAIDPITRYIYVADAGNRRIQKFDTLGNFILKWGERGTGEGQFEFPQAITVDFEGYVYVVDSDLNRVQKFDPSGNFILMWGSGGSGQGEFSHPQGIAADTLSNIYVSDTDNHRIQKFDSSGNFLLSWGSFGEGDGEFNEPKGIEVYGNYVYVADHNNHRIQKFDLEGNFIFQWGNPIRADGEFNYPSGVAVNYNTGEVYVADSYNNRIQKFDIYGNFILKWGKSGSGDGQFKSPVGIAVNPITGEVYVADGQNHRIQKFDSNGNFLLKWGSHGTGPGQFNVPRGVAVDPNDGSVYVADKENHRIQKFDSNGNFILSWGSYGTGEGELIRPFGVTVDPHTGHVLVADTQNDRIQVFDSNGNFLYGWGRPQAGNDPNGWDDGRMEWPRDVAVDASGNVYVADTDHDRIQKFDSLGNFILKWGSCGYGDGQFHPRSVAVDLTTNEVYVAASYTHRIQKFDSLGNFILSWGYHNMGPGEFNLPYGIAVDPVTNDVYVTDTYNHRIQKFDSNGNFLLKFGSWGFGHDTITCHPMGIAVSPDGMVFVGTAERNDTVPSGDYMVKVFDRQGNFLFKFGSRGNGDGQFKYRPTGIAIGNNAVYVTDIRTDRVQKFDLSGNFLLKWGTEGSGDGQFRNPWGIAVDKTTGWVYVADEGNHRVQKFDSLGNFLLKWGTEGTRDGQFKNPKGIAVDSYGNVYVVDNGNSRIQVFDPYGNFLFKFDNGGEGFLWPKGVAVDSRGDVYVLEHNRVLKFRLSRTPVLILDLSQNPGSGPIIKSLLDDFGVSNEFLTRFPSNLNPYENIFICLGVRPNNRILTANDANLLVSYLEGGGNVYMEGADAWFHDPQSSFYAPYFGINGVSDSSSSFSFVTGEMGTFAEGMNFEYVGEALSIDQIEPLDGATRIFINPSDSTGLGVAYDAGLYKTIGVSFEFEGLIDGEYPSTRRELMRRILDYLSVNSPPGNFSLLSPGNGEIVHLPVNLDWEDAIDPNSGDFVFYTLYLSPDTTFPDSNTIVIDSLVESQYVWNGVSGKTSLKKISPSKFKFTKILKSQSQPFRKVKGISIQKKVGYNNGVREHNRRSFKLVKGRGKMKELGVVKTRTSGVETLEKVKSPSISQTENSLYYWKVKAYDGRGGVTWSNETWFFYVYSYISGDCNGDNDLNLADLSFLANYLFFGGPSPDPLLAGDVNGDCSVDESDLSYLASYLLSNGPDPLYCQNPPLIEKGISDEMKKRISIIKSEGEQE
jgi:DNA-binding beta-propeller fold protein YncE